MGGKVPVFLVGAEACGLAEGEGHFGGGVVGGGVADFLPVRYGHRHTYSSTLNYTEAFHDH